MATTTVTDASFSTDVLGCSKPVLVDYWADWCGPCRQIAPVIEELSEAYGDKMVFAKLDTNDNTQVPAQYGIMALPTLQVFVNGEVVKSVTGAQSRGKLVKLIEEFV